MGPVGLQRAQNGNGDGAVSEMVSVSAVSSWRAPAAKNALLFQANMGDEGELAGRCFVAQEDVHVGPRFPRVQGLQLQIADSSRTEGQQAKLTKSKRSNTGAPPRLGMP